MTPWDDELDGLMRLVRKRLGEPVFDAALDRARAAAVARSGSLSAADDRAIASALSGTVLSLDTYYEALRAELRRLLTTRRRQVG